MSSYSTSYNPDVLSTLANLSSDEVFTPPHIANQILDLLPQELFSDKNTTFLDPATKSGVFLREITKRLLKGLENEIPDLQERIDHILNNQVFGIAITELTSLISRRSLYCSKYPNSKFSITAFVDKNGNILFSNDEHIWINDVCVHCGASKKVYDRSSEQERHAYQFIHNREVFNSMKFDVIVGNPPYQLDDGGSKASAMPIYNYFVNNSIKLSPRYLCMIIPSRWFSGGKNLNEFRKKMLEMKNIKIIHDFPKASDCFPGVEIKGGVNYFIWDREYVGETLVVTHSGVNITSQMKRPLKENGSDIFIRNNFLVSIFRKVQSRNLKSYSDIVSAAKAYGLRNDFFGNEKKYNLPEILDKKDTNCYKIYGLDSSQARVEKFIPKDYPLPRIASLHEFKFFVSESYGSGEFGELPAKEIPAGPGDLCTETFLEIGPFKSEGERDNSIKYWKTKFFRTMLGIKKISQHCSQKCYSFVPLIDFNEDLITDLKLYKYFDLSEDEILFIENNVKEITW